MKKKDIIFYSCLLALEERERENERAWEKYFLVPNNQTKTNKKKNQQEIKSRDVY